MSASLDHILLIPFNIPFLRLTLVHTIILHTLQPWYREITRELFKVPPAFHYAQITQTVHSVLLIPESLCVVKGFFEQVLTIVIRRLTLFTPYFAYTYYTVQVQSLIVYLLTHVLAFF